MKKIILIGMAIMMLALLSSCAPKVSQEEYDKVASNLTGAQAEIQSLQDDLSTAEGELEVAEEKLAQGRARVELINSAVQAGIASSRGEMTDAEAFIWLLEFGVLVEAVGDSELSAKFHSYMDCATTYDYYSDAYADAELSFYTYLIESTAEGLEIDWETEEENDAYD